MVILFVYLAFKNKENLPQSIKNNVDYFFLQILKPLKWPKCFSNFGKLHNFTKFGHTGWNKSWKRENGESLKGTKHVKL